jgi:hypothetical protein
MRMYTRGKLGAPMPDPYIHALIGAGPSRWVPASGELILDIEPDDAWQAATPGVSPSPFVRPELNDMSGTSAASA